MHIYGLTGGIGTGKSTVAKMLAEKGAAIVDADAVAREVVAPGSEGLREIVQVFGPEMLDEHGALDRLKLGEVVFADAEKRKVLEGITHPRIAMGMGKAIQHAVAEDRAVVILDIPLLYETGTMRGVVEKVLLVYAPAAVQEARVLARDPLPPEQVRARMASQIDIEEKRKMADIVIDNSGSLEETRAQIDELWAILVDPATR